MSDFTWVLKLCTINVALRENTFDILKNDDRLVSKTYKWLDSDEPSAY